MYLGGVCLSGDRGACLTGDRGTGLGGVFQVLVLDSGLRTLGVN